MPALTRMTAALTGLLMVAGPHFSPAAIAQAAAATRQTQHALKPFVAARDGRLGADQIKMYIAVRRLALKVPASGAPTDLASQVGQLAASLSREAEACAELGADLREYRWVGARIAEVRPPPAASAGDQIVEAIAAAARQSGASIAANAKSSEPPDAIKATATTEAARAHNRQLVDRHRAELDALEASSRR